MKTTIIVAMVFICNFKILAQNFEWARNMGGTDQDEGYSIAVDASGNVYTLGNFMGTADFDPGAGVFNITAIGDRDVFITKFDASGNFVWAKSVGGTDTDVPGSLTLDALGNVYVTGSYQGTVDFDSGVGVFNITSVNGFDCFILKLNASGNFLWAKSIGGISAQQGQSIIFDPSGYIYTTGIYMWTTDFDPGVGTFNLTPSGSNAFISKLDTAGNFVWAIGMGATSSSVTSIALDAVGSVYITGIFDGAGDFDPGIGTFNLTSAGGWDIFISKVNSSGNFVWAKNIGGIGEDYGNSISVSPNGNVYTTGRFEGSIDFNPGAGIFNLTSAGGTDAFISKLDALGNFVWAKRIGGTNAIDGESVVLDASENIYSIGSFQGLTDFDPGIGTYNLSPFGCNDIYIAKLDSSGNFVWAKKMGGSSCESGVSITIDVAQKIYATGRFSGTGDFNPETSIYNLTSAGFDDIFVVKFSQTTVGVSEIENKNSSIYPNPTTGIVNFGSQQQFIEVYSIDGKLLLQDFTNQIDIENYKRGLYLLIIKDQEGKELYKEKLIKE